MPGYAVGPGDHVDVPLSNYLAMYRPLGSIADEVCPIIPVKRRSDKFYSWDKASLLRTGDDSRRARGARPRMIEPTESLSGYLAVEYELGTMIEDSDIPNTDSVLRLEQVKVQYVADVIRIQREVRVAALLRLAANSGSLGTSGVTLAGTARYDSSAPDPIGDIRTGVETLRKNTGYKPNTLVIPAEVASYLIKIAAITALIQYVAGINYLRDYNLPLGGSSVGTATGSPAQPEYQYMPATFMGLRVFEPGTISNTAAEGATASYSDIWGKDIRLLYVNGSLPMMEIPSVAYTFRSTEYGTSGWNVRRWREEGPKSNFYAVGVVDAEVVVASDLGYVIASAIA